MSGTLPSPGSPLDDEDDVVAPEEEVDPEDDDVEAAPSGASVDGVDSGSPPVHAFVTATVVIKPGIAVTAAIPNHLGERPVIRRA
jgi:hypothetical protein